VNVATVFFAALCRSLDVTAAGACRSAPTCGEAGFKRRRPRQHTESSSCPRRVAAAAASHRLASALVTAGAASLNRVVVVEPPPVGNFAAACRTSARRDVVPRCVPMPIALLFVSR